MLLVVEVTKREISEGLKSIGSNKETGGDDYNPTFSKTTLPVIKEDLIDVVKEFFFIQVNCIGLLTLLQFYFVKLLVLKI